MATMDEISKGLSSAGANALRNVSAGAGKGTRPLEQSYAQARIAAHTMGGKQSPTTSIRRGARNQGAIKRALMGARNRPENSSGGSLKAI